MRNLPAELVGPARPDDLGLLIAVAASHRYHVTQGWNATWSVARVIENIVATMGDLDLTGVTDPATHAILSRPVRSLDLARHIDHVSTELTT